MLEKPYFLKLQEVFKDWQKFMMKQSESCHTSLLSVPIESLAEMKPETKKCYLEWLDQRFKLKAFSLLSKTLSRMGNLNAIIRHQGYKFGPFVTNRQRYFKRLHRQWMQT